LTRSRACHPDKIPGNPDATHAFQKLTIAYEVLSKPASRRLYDTRPTSSRYDVFTSRPPEHAEETFRNVIVGIFNDFLDGDLEIIRNLLRALNDTSPSLRLADDGIDSVLVTLQSIRERALSALHSHPASSLHLCIFFQSMPYLHTCSS